MSVLRFGFMSCLISPCLSRLCCSVSIVIFNTFSCQDVGADDSSSSENTYMTADYSVSCSTQRYTFAFWWALTMVR